MGKKPLLFMVLKYTQDAEITLMAQKTFKLGMADADIFVSVKLTSSVSLNLNYSISHSNVNH